MLRVTYVVCHQRQDSSRQRRIQKRQAISCPDAMAVTCTSFVALCLCRCLAPHQAQQRHAPRSKLNLQRLEG